MSYCRKLFTTLILLSGLLLSMGITARAQQVVFYEPFDGNSLDLTRWAVWDNRPYQEPGASLTVDNKLIITRGASNDNNGFLGAYTNEDFSSYVQDVSYEVEFMVDNIANWQDNPLGFHTPLGVWSFNNFGKGAIVYQNSLGQQVTYEYRFYPWFPLSSLTPYNLYKFKIETRDGKLRFLLDKNDGQGYLLAWETDDYSTPYSVNMGVLTGKIYLSNSDRGASMYDNLLVTRSAAPEPFCDDFEDGNGWQTRWTNIYGSQTLVSSPTHSGSGALKFRGTGQPGFECHSVLRRIDFQAGEGTYSAWFNQQHFEAGVWINIQVQPDPDQHPTLRPCYVLEMSAQNSQGGSFVLRRNDGLGGSDILLNVPPQFKMNEWIRAFIKRILPDTLIVGYEQNAQVYSYTVVDPSPITATGGFYISSCSDGPLTDNFYDDVCYEPLGPSILNVDLDIKPQSCPNPLNVGDMGVLPVAILGTSGFDVSQIDPASIQLEGVAPADWSTQDVATPIPDSDDSCFCHALGPDEFVDLVLHFTAQEIVSALGSYSNWEMRALTLTGEMINGTPIEGKDCVRIQIPQKRSWRGIFGKGEGPQNAGYGPTTFELLGNYPNPFNATTTISYSLPQNAEVNLVIYNVAGQKVRTVIEGNQSAGIHSLVWDGRNDSGQPVASGIYFYRLKAGELTSTRRMTLLK